MPQQFAGVDAGKTHHHCVVVDGAGKTLLSRRLANRETDIRHLLADVAGLRDGAETVWATDLNYGGAGLLHAVLTDTRQQLHYISGRAVYHAALTYRGEAKTDAKDAGIIADQARVRTDLAAIRPVDEVSAELRMLAARREDLVHDRTRAVNRLRAVLSHYFPSLEAAFNYAGTKTPVVLLTKYQTPAAIRRVGERRLATWLKGQGCWKSADVAAVAVRAAAEQNTPVPGEAAAARMVSHIARDLLRIREQIAEVKAEIMAVLPKNPLAEPLMSIPGFGARLTADVLAIVGSDLSHFQSPDRFASYAGLAPVPRDSGKVSGNHHRPRRYDRRLLNACYQAAFIAARRCPVSKAFYERKRREGKSHKQALIALARRRINVMWAILRDGSTYRSADPIMLIPRGDARPLGSEMMQVRAVS